MTNRGHQRKPKALNSTSRLCETPWNFRMSVAAWIIMKAQHWLNLAYASATSIAIVLAWLIVGK